MKSHQLSNFPLGEGCFFVLGTFLSIRKIDFYFFAGSAIFLTTYNVSEAFIFVKPQSKENFEQVRAEKVIHFPCFKVLFKPVKMESLNISRNFKFKILRREKKMMVPHALLVKFWEGN